MPARWDGEISRRSTPHDDACEQIVRAALALGRARAGARKIAELQPEAAGEIEEAVAAMLLQLDALAEGVQDLKRRYLVRVHGPT